MVIINQYWYSLWLLTCCCDAVISLSPGSSGLVVSNEDTAALLHCPAAYTFFPVTLNTTEWKICYRFVTGNTIVVIKGSKFQNVLPLTQSLLGLGSTPMLLRPSGPVELLTAWNGSLKKKKKQEKKIRKESQSVQFGKDHNIWNRCNDCQRELRKIKKWSINSSLDR